MSKPTPGPWEVPQPIVEGNGPAYTPVVATTLIAKVYSTAYRDHEQSLANARLIAAAPDLLEALKGLVEVVGKMKPATGEPYGRAVAELLGARAAIAKAEGK